MKKPTSRRSAPCALTCSTTRTWKPGCRAASTRCPTGAMKFYEMEPAEFEKLAKQEGFEGYRSAELKNQPHVVYKNLFKYTKNFITAGVLVNGDCFENATVTLKSKAACWRRRRPISSVNSSSMVWKTENTLSMWRRQGRTPPVRLQSGRLGEPWVYQAGCGCRVGYRLIQRATARGRGFSSPRFF